MADEDAAVVCILYFFAVTVKQGEIMAHLATLWSPFAPARGGIMGSFLESHPRHPKLGHG